MQSGTNDYQSTEGEQGSQEVPDLKHASNGGDAPLWERAAHS